MAVTFLHTVSYDSKQRFVRFYCPNYLNRLITKRQNVRICAAPVTMSRQTRLGVEQAIELLEDSDVEGGWSESEDEDDGDETYLPDALELAQLEVEETDRSLNDSDMQHEQAQLENDTEVQNSTETHDDDHSDADTQERDMSQSLVTVGRTVVM